MNLDKYLKSDKDFNPLVDEIIERKIEAMNDSGIHATEWNESTAYAPTDDEGIESEDKMNAI